jgi:hypothetical protein
MTDVKQVHQKALGAFYAAHKQAEAEYQQAQLAGDVDGMAYAAQQMAGYRASARELNSMAAEASYVPPPPLLAGGDQMSRADVALATKYGLDANRLAVAKGWTNDESLSDEAKIQSYLANEQRYRHMRQTGEYDDSQGKMFKR